MPADCSFALSRRTIGLPGAKLLDWDFCLMDSTPSRLSGIHSEFIESPRLDNLASTFAAFEALVEASRCQSEGAQGCGETDILVAVAFDHEEVGSESLSGANSNILEVAPPLVPAAVSYIFFVLVEAVNKQIGVAFVGAL